MTPDDYAIEFINATTVPIQIDSKSYRRLVSTIAAAVAAEHQRTLEQCAKVATEYHSDDCDDQCCTCRPIAAAIRALP